jgi:NitT/TauT family transport system ATP-binding protein
VAGLETASTGDVLLDGRALRGPGGDRGFVFQNDNLLPWRTVYSNAIIGREVAGRVGLAERAHTLELLKLVGLEGFENYHPRQLSGGMRQRVNLARALAIDPEILLMDEPFSSLDAQTREIMQTELLRIWEDGRKTVLFVTHQIDEAVFLSDRVLVFARRPGRLLENVSIDLPRPRALAIKRTPEFVAYVDRIWRLIEDDVRASVIEEKV